MHKKRRKLELASFLVLLPFILFSQNDEGNAFNYPEIVNFQLILYTDSGNYDKVKELLDFGISPNVSTYDGNTPLMYASQNGYYSIAKLLIENGANVNAVPYDGNTALHASVLSNHDSIAELLMDNDADVNHKNNWGLTPLHYTAAYGYPFLAKLLIYFGANIDEEDNQGNTPLIAAVYSGARTVTEILLENWADVNHTDNNGFTPLMISSQFNDTSMVKLLISYDANILHRNTNGTTALALAIRYEALETAKMLIEYGAAEEDFSEDRSYIQLSREYGMYEIIPLLSEKGLESKNKFRISAMKFHGAMLFNENDFFFDFGSSMLESKTKIAAGINFAYRPYKKAVLNEQESEYYQYWEHRRVIGFSTDKNLNIKRLQNGASAGFTFGLTGNYTWGSYTYPDARAKPNSYFYFSPRVGIFVDGQYFFISGAVEYNRKLTTNSFPIFFNLKTGFIINLNKDRIVYKSISWM